MQMPTVTEISALSAHRREVELVRWSLVAVPERDARVGTRGAADPLRGVTAAALARTAVSRARRAPARPTT
jgi:hypothetical protein